MGSFHVGTESRDDVARLRAVKLVTFDVFGTLLDWRGYVEKLFPGGYRSFLSASEPLQQEAQAVFPYTTLLTDVFMTMGESRLSQVKARTLAEDFGQAAPFSDARALQEIAPLTLIGCVSNSDARHQLDAQRNLSVNWDVCLLAEDLGAYKPARAAWEAAVLSIRQRWRIKPGEWLHVSAYAGFDLIPAKKFGLLTCFIPRRGGSDVAETDGAKPDFILSDLFQLAELLREAHGGPIRYAVTAKAASPEIGQDFIRWMRFEHGADLLAVPGCLRFEVYQTSASEVTCEYLFKSHSALQHYFTGAAPLLRAKGRERFSEEQIQFGRSESRLVAAGMRSKS